MTITAVARDTDVDELARRIVKVQAEIADLGAEAIRIRDQHRQQIDAMKAAPPPGQILEQNAIWHSLQKCQGDLQATRSLRDAELHQLEFVAKERDAREKERDAREKERDEMRQQRDEARAQRDVEHTEVLALRQTLAENVDGLRYANVVAERDALLLELPTFKVLLRSTEAKLAFAQSEVAKLNSFTDIGAAVTQQRALEAARAALAPPELVAWAKDAVRRFPAVEHSEGAYEVLPGVTIRALRAWLANVPVVPVRAYENGIDPNVPQSSKRSAT